MRFDRRGLLKSGPLLASLKIRGPAAFTFTFTFATTGALLAIPQIRPRRPIEPDQNQIHGDPDTYVDPVSHRR